MSYEKMCSVGVIKRDSILTCIDVHFFGEWSDPEEWPGQMSKGEQLLNSEGHQIQMFDVTEVVVMHSGYTTSPKSIHVFLDL